MVVVSAPTTKDDQIIHLKVSWDVYRAMAADLGDHSHVRLTYDGETLEIMSPGPVHEFYANFLSEILTFVLDEWEIDHFNSGSTTFQLDPETDGFEPDKSYYVSNLPGLRVSNSVDLSVDPAPDLAVEIDITNRRKCKKQLYERLGVKEFWRFDLKSFEAFGLVDGKYIPIETSRVIEGLPLGVFVAFLRRGQIASSNRAIISELKQWLRDNRGLHRP